MKWRLDVCFLCGNSVPGDYMPGNAERFVMLSWQNLRVHMKCQQISTQGFEDNLDSELADFAKEKLGLG